MDVPRASVYEEVTGVNENFTVTTRNGHLPSGQSDYCIFYNYDLKLREFPDPRWYR